MQSCELFKQITQPREDPPVVERDTVPDKEEVVVLPEDTVTISPDIDTTRTYHVAVLLPFSLDQTFIDSFDHQKRTTRYQPLIATELYEGMVLALEDLDRLGVSVKVSVIDTKNDLSEINYWLTMQDVANVDMIIGPLFPQNLASISSYAQKAGIWLVSPYSGYVALQEDNPWYLNPVPNLWAHQKTMADFLWQKDTARQLFIIHSASANDRHLGRQMMDHLKAMAPFTEVPPATLIEAPANGQYDSTLLSMKDTNWVILTSYNEVFINNVVRLLNRHTKKRPIRLMGMPGWLDQFESLRLDYLNNLSLHITKGLVMDTSSAQYDSVVQRYRNRFGFAPSANTLLGYEVMYTQVSLLIQQKLPPSLFNPVIVKGISSGVQYVAQTYSPENPSPPVIRWFVNGQVKVFKYDQYRLKPVAP